MASIKKYKTAKGHAWRVQYRSPDGRARTKQGFPTKTEARSWADKNAVTIREGDWINPGAGNTTVTQLGEEWIQHQTHLKPSTLATTTNAWKNHVKPVWGERRISTIRTSEVQAWVSSMTVRGFKNGQPVQVPASPSMVRKAHAVLAQVLDVAVSDGMLKANPARAVKLPRKAAPVKVFLTAEQLATLARECTTKGEIVWVLGTVGLRWGELAGLQVGDIDFLRRRIHIKRNAVTVKNKVIVGTPKVHEARTVSASATVLAMLEPLTRGKNKEVWLWERRGGGPMVLPSRGSFFHEAVKRCRARDPEFPAVTLHGLRHVAAGLLVQSGANVKVVQRQLGHASAAMTLDVYAELFDGDLDSVGERMEEVVSNVVELSWNSGFGGAGKKKNTP